MRAEPNDVDLLHAPVSLLALFVLLAFAAVRGRLGTVLAELDADPADLTDVER